MSQFTTELIVKPVGKNTWELVEGFEYHIGSYPSEEVIYVPSGFITDFASVPRIFWPIISPTGIHGKAAVVHDYCYATACYTRSKSDKIFLEAMEVLEVTKWKREVMYQSAVCFGLVAWNRHRKKEQDKI